MFCGVDRCNRYVSSNFRVPSGTSGDACTVQRLLATGAASGGRPKATPVPETTGHPQPCMMIWIFAWSFTLFQNPRPAFSVVL